MISIRDERAEDATEEAPGARGVGWLSPSSKAALLAGGLLSGLGGAALLAVSQLAWTSPQGLWLSLLLLSPPAVVLAELMGVAGATAAGRPSVFRVASKARALLAAGALLALLLLLLLLLGVYLSNKLWTDPPLAGYTLVGYGVTAAVVGLVGYAASRAWKHPRLEPLVDAVGWRAFVAAGLFVSATVLSLLDGKLYPLVYLRIHLATELASLVCYILGLQVITSRQGAQGRRSLWASLAALVLLALVASPLALARGKSIEEQSHLLAKFPTVHRRALLLARGLVDRDRDGFSPILGGGDCDDRDPHTYPLSLVGTDCLGWRYTAPAASPPPPSPAPAPSDQGPELILLLTVDALRCGDHERPELRDICPELGKFASKNDHSSALRVAYPATAYSVRAMHRVWNEGIPLAGEPLPAQLRRAGYRTSIIATHPNLLADPEIRAGFDEVDLSIAPKTIDQETSRATNARIRERLASRDGKLFLWAHYFDPHAPYVGDPPERWQPSSIEAYRKAVRHTDAQIGKLLEHVEASLSSIDYLLIITADHGEEFGEHGGYHHGSNLYDTALRVPFHAARPRHPGTVLPASSYDIGRYLLAQATGGSFRPSPDVFSSTLSDSDEQIALTRGNLKLIRHTRLGFTELFDLNADPFERHDLSGQRPAMVRVLGSTLARFRAP